MLDLEIVEIENSVTLDSRLVAEMINKKHSDLLRDIETYIQYFYQNADLRSDDFFIKSGYVAGTGKTYKNYQITKKGCEFLAHKLTGQKGAIFTAKYINEFEKLRLQNYPTNESVIKKLEMSQKKMMDMINQLTKTVESLSKNYKEIEYERTVKTHEIDKLIKNQSAYKKHKIQLLPKEIVEVVNILLSQDDRNFSYISRYLYKKGYNVSNVAVSNYYYSIFRG